MNCNVSDDIVDQFFLKIFLTLIRLPFFDINNKEGIKNMQNNNSKRNSNSSQEQIRFFKFLQKQIQPANS